jgi:hypothetical protein
MRGEGFLVSLKRRWLYRKVQWNINLKMMASKECQYLQQLANYKVQ